MLPKAQDESPYGDVLTALDRHLVPGRWPDVSMSDLAVAGGVSRGYLYKHFGNREGLLLAVLELRARRFNSVVRPLVESIACPEAIVQGVLRGVEVSRVSPFDGPLMGAPVWQAGALKSESLRRAVVVARELWHPVVVRALARDELREEVLADDLIEWLVMVQLVLCSRAGSLEDPLGLDRWVRTLLASAVRGPAGVLESNSLRVAHP